ncbi:hypothetical protein Bca52824_003820 [Brassica carinata]|uniref:Uncharacterized protein n=1 Tax=Brassica carinata TaxID=52824 RepID=A0A8X7WPI3_BRACI|nr:hypothetical protein Bca52824_003820 [Brassica carinata]
MHVTYIRASEYTNMSWFHDVAAAVQNNRRSVDMVEALFRMNQAYLSLPEVSVDGLVAIMTGHYSLSEESKSKGEGDGSSGVTREKLHV